MAQLFKESAYIFVENDSRDSSKEQLQSWCANKENARIVSLDGLAAVCSEHTVRIATARNEYLKIVKSEYKNFDYMIVLDCDNVSVQTIEGDLIRRAIEFLDREPQSAAVFSNSKGHYYDLWALRHNALCPDDVWEAVCDFALNKAASDNEAYEAVFRKRLFQMDSNEASVEVESAFGGLGIYKITSVLRNDSIYVGSKRKVVPNSFITSSNVAGTMEVGWQLCEHVSFNAGFKANGEKLFILPYLINCTTSEVKIVRYSASAWRRMLFRPRLSVQFGSVAQNESEHSGVRRNDICPCGSGKKFKHCHGSY
jgi:hypothetical protein